MTEPKAKRETPKNKKTKEKPKNENKRINFLHKAAFVVSMQGTSTNDAFAKISRGYARISKEVSNKEALKIPPSYSRCFCRKCRQVFASSEGADKMEIDVDGNCLVRTCLNCGSKRRFQMSEKHQTRSSEEFKKSIHSTFLSTT